MEIKLNLRLQTILNLIHFLENMELETAALIIVAVLMTPMIIYSLWTLTIEVLCQLFWLGVKAGLALTLVCFSYMAYLLASTRSSSGSSACKCTIGDIVFSVLFQTGIRFPAAIWDRLMTFAIGGDQVVDTMHGINKDGYPVNFEEDLFQELDNELGWAEAEGQQEPDPIQESDAEGNMFEGQDRREWYSDIGASGDYNVHPRSNDVSDAEVIRKILSSSPPSFPLLASASSDATLSTVAVINGPAAKTRTRRRHHAGGQGTTGNRRSSRNK